MPRWEDCVLVGDEANPGLVFYNAAGAEPRPIAVEPARGDRTAANARMRTVGELGLAVTALLAVAVLAALPFTVGSMVAELRGQDGAVYDLQTGNPVGPGEEVDPATQGSLNVAAVDLDEVAGSLTLAVSGNRVCAGECPAARLTFAALDDASQRRGIAPFAIVSLAAGETLFSERVARALPVRRVPNLARVRRPSARWRRGAGG